MSLFFVVQKYIELIFATERRHSYSWNSSKWAIFFKNHFLILLFNCRERLCICFCLNRYFAVYRCAFSRWYIKNVLNYISKTGLRNIAHDMRQYITNKNNGIFCSEKYFCCHRTNRKNFKSFERSIYWKFFTLHCNDLIRDVNSTFSVRYVLYVGT